MNHRQLLLVASLALAAVTACSNNGGTSDGGSTTTTGASATGGGSSSGATASSGGSSGGPTASTSHGASSGGSTTGLASTGASSSTGSATATGASSAGFTSSGSSAGSTGGMSAGSTSGSTGGAFPNPPTLNAQIDRLGRPAVNTALTNPLNLPIDNPLGPDAGLDEGAAKDQYNATVEFDAAGNPLWPAFTAQFAQSLAIYDALDGVCGNQLIYNFGQLPDAGPSVTSYGTLATVLTDDELYLDTTQTACNVYLALEANSVAPQGSPQIADCGGRTPNEAVIDETYSLLAIGQPSGVTDGLNHPANPNGAAKLTTFPYLLPPL